MIIIGTYVKNIMDTSTRLLKQSGIASKITSINIILPSNSVLDKSFQLFTVVIPSSHLYRQFQKISVPSSSSSSSFPLSSQVINCFVILFDNFLNACFNNNNNNYNNLFSNNSLLH
ncbi:unnamed protein product [Schistosoma curassoni]|uniref:Uncharacterized protein n=1 Tax=Schistosoma curassoni TaxID=6186 RepID=A0A183JZQ1_9TREM|nr:unnamed protein product [Schistosoma curassoni]